MFIRDRYREYEEEELAAEDVLRERTYSDKVLEEVKNNYGLKGADAEVASVVQKRWYEKLFFQRFLVLVDNDDLRKVLDEQKVKTMNYEEFLETYEEKEEEA
jgi:hypothetical protein